VVGERRSYLAGTLRPIAGSPNGVSASESVPRIHGPSRSLVFVMSRPSGVRRSGRSIRRSASAACAHPARSTATETAPAASTVVEAERSGGDVPTSQTASHPCTAPATRAYQPAVRLLIRQESSSRRVRLVRNPIRVLRGSRPVIPSPPVTARITAEMMLTATKVMASPSPPKQRPPLANPRDGGSFVCDLCEHEEAGCPSA
jgi:hypothetical protein